MTSDILILLKTPVDDRVAEDVKAAIYGVTKSAIVNFNSEPGKVFLVRFDPDQDHASAILSAVREGGWEATMAGG